MTRDPWGCFVNLSCPSILTSHISRSKHIQPGNPHNTMRLGHFLEGLRGEVYTPTNQLLTKPTRLYTNSKFDIDTQNDAIVKAGDYIFQGPSCLVYIYDNDNTFKTGWVAKKYIRSFPFQKNIHRPWPDFSERMPCGT